MASFALPRVMGHRGAAAVAPENTLISIRRAAEAGATWVEVDSMLTGDDIAVLFHDDLLARTTGAAGLLAETEFEALHALEVGRWFGRDFAGEPLPSLEAAVALVGELGIRANFEIKPSEGRDRITAERVVNTLEACWPAEGPPPMISSFKSDCLEIAQARRPDWPRAFITLHPEPAQLQTLARLGCVSYHCYHKRLTPETADAVKGAGYALACFTVNEPEDAARLYAMGVDCMITDDPKTLLDASV